ncbi:death-associated protein kinase 1-like [Lycorma delicatula]|uniref:death-associated protein kinase 1-like n=1 Tax=Lycorma delicatula TaxID=130591 RepID=UPI003F5179F0
MNFSLDSFEDVYDVFEELGKGHFAVVRRCVNKKDGSEYAAKVIRKKRVCRGVSMEDIQREVETLSRLHHTNIVTLHEVYDTGQHVVLLLELVTGGELFHFVEEQTEGHLTEKQSVHIIKQILDAVAHMHNLYLAHLDLKPENVLLVEKCEYPLIKVIDFGLTQQLDTVSEIKTVFGTPEFVAPEVINFDVLSLATDMWSIGVITYILLSGASPFLGETKQDTFSNVSSGTFSFDKEYFETVSSQAKDFISRLLVKDPRRRDTVRDCLKHSWIKDNIASELITMEPEAANDSSNNKQIPLSLVEAVEKGDNKSVEDALSRNDIDLFQVNKNGETSLHVAARLGNISVVRILVSAGASLTATDCNGETPLLHAARHGHLDTLQFLIMAGSCLTTQNKEGEHALHVASAWGHHNCVSTLVENGATTDTVNNFGASPLHIALSRRNSDIALYLIHVAAAEYELQDMAGDTPLHIAAREGLLSVAQALCTLNCTVDVANRQGLYPIHLAARQGHTEIVRCLCLAGCNTEQKNGDGIKAEITAIKHGHNDISFLLNKMKISSTRESYVRQLMPLKEPVPRINIQLFGHSGVGKSTLVETLKAGYFSSFFRRHKASACSFTNGTTSASNITAAAAITRSQPSSPNKIHIEMDLTSRQNSLNFDLYNYHYTRGIDVQQVSLPIVGDVTTWDFSGQDTYFPLYHHLVTTDGSNAILILVFNLEDSPSIQLRQCCFWLSFLQARIPPNEPIGPCGKTANTAYVMLVGTHADKTRLGRNSHGEYCSLQAQVLVKQLREKFSATFEIYPTVVLLDAQAAHSTGIKQLKTCLSSIKSKLIQVVPQMTGFCSAVLSWLPTLRKTSSTFPVLSWDAFVDMTRTQVNPLASDGHMRELLSQLLHMGEVVYIKSTLHPDLLVINPSWLCGQIIGQLLSIDFIAQARITGCYTVDDFQVAFPEADALAMLQVLETLHLCVQCENDGEIEYEFPCYNLVETVEGLWDENDPRYTGDSCYGGVRLHTPPGTVHLLHSIFPCIQVELRGCDPENDLYQWFRGSKLSSGLLEALITLHEDQGGTDYIEIKVRGPPMSSTLCFFLIEELLSVIDQVLLEMSPGLAVEKHVLSVADLRTHSEPPHCFPPSELMMALLQPTRLETTVYNPLADCYENLKQLVAFNDSEVESVMVCADQLSVGCLSSIYRQALCSMLDPPDPLGKDWCMLALQLGLADCVPAIESSTNSPTATLLDFWATKQSSSLGELIKTLQSLGRDDAANVVLRGAPLYHVSQQLMECSDTPSISSRNISR